MEGKGIISEFPFSPEIAELYEQGGEVLRDRSAQSDEARRALEMRRRREEEKLYPPPPLVF